MAELPQNHSAREERTVSNLELYDTWAQTYDTDKNILQAIDSQEFPLLLQAAFSSLSSSSTPPSQILAIDYGCGTGRNTNVLLSTTTSPPISSIHAMDPSSSMLSLAHRYASESPHLTKPEIIFHHLPQTPPGTAFPLPTPEQAATLLISTLVLEHVPLAPFFELCNRAVRVGGYVILTNMHQDMGAKSRAGFLDETTGTKVRGLSYVHSAVDVVTAGTEAGWRLVGTVKEKGVEESDVEILGQRARKWIGCMVWFGFIMERVGLEG